MAPRTVSFRKELRGELAGQERQRGLGGSVRREVALRQVPRGRRDVHDRPALTLQHVRDHQPTQQEGRRHVESQRPLEHRLARVESTTRGRPAGVVDEDVDPIELLERPRHELLELGGVQHVTGNRQCPPAEAADLLRNRLDLLRRPGGAHHVGSHLGECEGSAFAEAAPGAGHDRHLVVEPESIQNHRRTPSIFTRAACSRSGASKKNSCPPNSSELELLSRNEPAGTEAAL
jgi:hypothetical protein